MSNSLSDNTVDDAKGKAVAHTPGPWLSQGWVPTWAYIPVKDARHNLVASLYPDTGHGYSRDQVEANARLIAAAPDLLEACQAAKDFLVRDLVEPGRTVFWKLVAALDKARERHDG